MLRRMACLIAMVLATVPVQSVPAHAASCPELNLRLKTPDKGTVSANLSGAQVVPAPGDPDGTGTVTLTITIDNQEASIEYQLDTTNVATPLEGAHIHFAQPGDTGRSVVNLFGFTDQPDRSGVVTGVSKCLGHQILHQPQDYYVDVHNVEYPDQGAVRGQLS
jgi:hypothetical protein